MTNEQFTHWEEFATRMAEHYPDAPETRKSEIVEKVKEYFWWRHYQDDWHGIRDWDGNGDDYFLCDAVDEFFDNIRLDDETEELNIDTLFNQVICCIRAGFDVAVKPSGGVVGFTAGDIRQMWDGEVPNWVKEFWEDPFDEIPDEEDVWLC